VLELPDRPAPAHSLVDRVRAWVLWIGVGRIAASTAAVLIVLAGGYWLVKPPAATTESKLPYAGTATTVFASTTSTVASATTAATALLVVHVAGAVTAPGVYQVAAGSRVIDAVAAAGGFAADANPDAVNLAALVVDSERVYVPALGEAVTPAVIATGGSVVEVWPININSANAVRLDDLPGVGPATAAAIIAHRDERGPFATVDQLADVRGIGPAKLDAIRSLVTV